MINEIITTFSSSIASIQLNFFDFGVHKPKIWRSLKRKISKNLKHLETWIKNSNYL